MISGRGLADLRFRLGPDERWKLSGSHGAEIAGETDQPITLAASRQLDEVAAHLDALSSIHPGSCVERKPRGVAFHYRCVEDSGVGEAVCAVTALAAECPALVLRLGSMVIEFLADTVTKGDGIRRIRHRVGASAVVFIGDDLTDEHGFLALGSGDAGVKIGPGDTRAQFRLGGIDQVARLLALLADDREAWVRGRRLMPITAHSMLSDQRTVALVTPHARVTWLCLPRIDSPPLFAELLGGSAAGFFEIAPVDPAGPPTQVYDGDSLVLQTRWPQCTVTDYLDCGSGRAFQRAGRSDLIRVVEGTSICRVRFAPRLDFGRVGTRLAVREHGLEVEGSSDPLLLHSPGVQWRVSVDGPHQTADAEIDPRSGPIVFELRAGSANDRPHSQSERQRRQSTQRFWSGWADSLRLPTLASEQVKRSALLLRALVHGPTGAIAAAATTSLPEHLGGQRNGD